MTHYNRVLNEALRAEAEYASALERLEVETAHRRAYEGQVRLMRMTIDAAHKILDTVPFLSNRDVSHMGLQRRVQKIVDAWRRERQPNVIRGLKATYWIHDDPGPADLGSVSTDSIKMMAAAHVKLGVPLDKELAAEMKRRNLL